MPLPHFITAEQANEPLLGFHPTFHHPRAISNRDLPVIVTTAKSPFLQPAILGMSRLMF